MGLVPLYGLLEPVLEIHASAEAELLFRLRRVEFPPRLPVGLAAVPSYSPAKLCRLSNDVHQVTDAYLKGGSEIHWLPFVIALRSENDSFSRIVHVQEFAGRRSVAPYDDL